MFPPVKQSKQDCSGYPYFIHVSNGPMGISYHVDYYYSLGDPWLDDITWKEASNTAKIVDKNEVFKSLSAWFFNVIV